MQTTWIDEADALEAFCESLDADALAVDTESNHFHAYQAQVCLIQLAADGRAALVDPLAVGEEGLAPLFALLEDPRLTKILHAARNDILEFNRDWGIEIEGLFDTRTAARFLGYPRNSLSWLLEELVGVEDPGGFSRFDWTTRPLPDPALNYAVEDVAHLPELRTRFLGELEDSGWLSPFRQRCELVARQTRYEPSEFDPEGWRDIKQGRNLDGRGRATLRELYQWRHELCTRRNEAALHVFRNKALAKVARDQPRTIEELRAIKGVPGDVVDEEGEAILEAVERARTQEMPPARKPRRPRDPPSRQEKARYDALRRWRNETAEELDIPGEFIGTNAVFNEIAANPPQSVEELSEFDAILPWHCNLFGDEMLRVIREAD